VLATAQPYTDPGPTALSRLTTQRLTRQAVKRLQDLGYQVTIAPRTDAAWPPVPASRLAIFWAVGSGREPW